MLSNQIVYMLKGNPQNSFLLYRKAKPYSFILSIYLNILCLYMSRVSIPSYLLEDQYYYAFLIVLCRTLSNIWFRISDNHLWLASLLDLWWVEDAFKSDCLYVKVNPQNIFLLYRNAKPYSFYTVDLFKYSLSIYDQSKFSRSLLEDQYY